MRASFCPELALSHVPEGLRAPLLEEYNKLIRNFRENRWEPAELNGGKLCEIVYSILDGYVNGVFPASPSKPRNMIDSCKKLEQAEGFPRSVRIQIPRMLVALYEIRNNRNVGHVGADVDPNHMDASVVLAMAKWILAELVRIFHGVSTEKAAIIVDGLTERNVPIIWKVDERRRVLSPKLPARDKLLLLVYDSSGEITGREVAESIEYKNFSQFRKKIIIPAHKEALVDYDPKNDRLLISPLGIKYVEDNIPFSI